MLSILDTLHNHMPKSEYDKNFANGRFAKGNKCAVGHNSKANLRLNQLRELWYEANSLKDMMDVKNSLMDLIKNCPLFDVRLKAIQYYCDRQLGKPTERVEMDVQNETTTMNMNLTPEQLEQAKVVWAMLQESKPAEVKAIE